MKKIITAAALIAAFAVPALAQDAKPTMPAAPSTPVAAKTDTTKPSAPTTTTQAVGSQAAGQVKTDTGKVADAPKIDSKPMGVGAKSADSTATPASAGVPAAKPGVVATPAVPATGADVKKQ